MKALAKNGFERGHYDKRSLLPTSEKWPAGDSGGRPPTALTT
jgi:hypothetical protein